MPATASFAVACLDCGQDYTFGRVTANMRCFCGSDNLTYEAADETPPGVDGFISIQYPKGLLGMVGPEGQGYHYSLARQDEGILYTAGWAPDEDSAKKIVETLAPAYAGARVIAKMDDACKEGFHSLCDTSGCDCHCHGDDPQTGYGRIPIKDRKTSSLGTWVAADFPPKKDDKDKKKDDDDKGGNETHPPSGDSGGEEAPAPAAGTPGEAPQAAPAAPGEVQVDPNAPPAPGAVPGEVVDPLLQVMDTAQQQVDAAVDQANQLGHDAKEVAYDVDQLFSNWRCQNCQIEGEANISDDGQVDLQGDLFDNQPCAAPAAPEQDPNQQVPQQNQQNQLPQGAPATNDQIPATQQNLPSQTAAIRYTPECDSCGWRGKTWNDQEWAQHEHDMHKHLPRGRGGCETNSSETTTGKKPTLPKSSSRTASDLDSDYPDQRNVLDQQQGTNPNLAKEERLTAMVEQILDTNPGMNAQAARRVAETTLAKFPSLAS